MRVNVVEVFLTMSITPPDSREEWITSQALERPLSDRAAFVEPACAGTPRRPQRVAALRQAREAAAAAPHGATVDPIALRQRIEAAMQAEQPHRAWADGPTIPAQALGHLKPPA